MNAKTRTYRSKAGRYIRGLISEAVEGWVLAALGGALALSVLTYLGLLWDGLTVEARWVFAFSLLLGVLLVIQTFTLRDFRTGVVAGAGLRRVYQGAHVPNIKDYDIADDSNFFFLGISAKHFVYDDEFRAKLIEINRRSCRIRFLLLLPKGRSMKRRAADEGADVDTWIRHITDSSKELLILGDSMSGTKIEIRFYDYYPVWRLIASSGGGMYVSYFLQNKRGKESPHLLLGNDGIDDLYLAFMRQYEETWERYSIDARDWLTHHGP